MTVNVVDVFSQSQMLAYLEIIYLAGIVICPIKPPHRYCQQRRVCSHHDDAVASDRVLLDYLTNLINYHAINYFVRTAQ